MGESGPPRVKKKHVPYGMIRSTLYNRGLRRSELGSPPAGRGPATPTCRSLVLALANEEKAKKGGSCGDDLH